MARNEEQFYGMFRDAFRDFTPEAPAHVFESVKANLGRERSFTSSRSLWAGLLVLLLGSGAAWYYISNADCGLANTPVAMATAVNGAIYKAHWSIDLEESNDNSEDIGSTRMQWTVSDEPGPTAVSGRTPDEEYPVNDATLSASSQSTGDAANEPALPEENGAPLSNPNPDAENTPYDSESEKAEGSVKKEQPDSVAPKKRKFFFRGRKTTTIEE